VGGCQGPGQLLPHSFRSRAGGENKVKKLVGRDKDREIAYRLPSQAKQMQLEENQPTLLLIKKKNRVEW